MRNIDPRALFEQTRSHLLRKVLDAEIIIHTAGVEHSDICPRNVMIIGLRTTSTEDVSDSLTIKIIDFNVATVNRYSRCYDAEVARKVDEKYRAWLPKLPSPILRWNGQMMEFAWDEWCPSGDGEPELWLWENYHDDERYIPVIWDPTNPDTWPEYVEIESGSKRSADSGLGLDMVIEKGDEGSNKNGFGSADHDTPIV